MKLSPLDIRHKEFQSTLNGFSKGQVRDFLARAADQFEERLEQIQQLSEQIRKQEKEIEELRVSDIELKRTLVTSEKLSGEFKLQATREADLLLKETQSKADVILRDAELQKRQLLKTAELQVEEANTARQKAEEAAKQIRERSIQEAAIQEQRAQNMVAGLKEQVSHSEKTTYSENVLDTQELEARLEAEHHKELAKLRHNSKTIIVQLKKDIAQLKAERGQMVTQLGVYDRNLEALEHKVTHNTSNQHLSSTPSSSKASTTSQRPKRRKTDSSKPKQATKLNTAKPDKIKSSTTRPVSNKPVSSKPNAKLKTKQVANALSNSIDNLMSDNFPISDSLGLSQSSLESSLKSPLKSSLKGSSQNTPKDSSTSSQGKKQAPKQNQQDNFVADTIDDYELYNTSSSEDIFNLDTTSVTDPMNITVTPVKETDHAKGIGRYAKTRETIITNNSFTENTRESNLGLSQHIYPAYPVKESSVQDRGRLITPPTVYDVENPFIDDGFDELDSLSESMVEKDSLSDIKGKEFDSNIFNIEDTIEHVSPKATVEHIEVLDTEWFENFELDDD